LTAARPDVASNARRAPVASFRMTQPSVTGGPAGIPEQLRQAEIFASLHRRDDPLRLPNAWGVASAVTIASTRAQAIATTTAGPGANAIAPPSAGVAWPLGLPDAADRGADRAAAVIGRITAAVRVPVSADIEAGYGPTPDAVAATVTAVIRAGAVGLNLEDRSGRDDTPLFEPAEQAERLAAARAAAGGPRGPRLDQRAHRRLPHRHRPRPGPARGRAAACRRLRGRGRRQPVRPWPDRPRGDRRAGGRAAAGRGDGLGRCPDRNRARVRRR